MTLENKKLVPPWRPALFSLLVPGSGQFSLGDRERGAGLLLVVAALAGLIAWRGVWALLIALGAIWLWNVWDAYRLAGGRAVRLTLPFVLGILIVYTLGIQATEIRPARLISGWPAMLPFARALTRPEFLAYPTEDLSGHVPIQVPCIDPLPEPDKTPSQAPRVTSVACAAVDDVIEVRGEGFFPNFEGEIWWM
ncbi:MAG: hypothetical protein JW934_04595, partial [Anaerolineae bacterium]|nr:hypothetical protein [Anaerolineae bacterium]